MDPAAEGQVAVGLWPSYVQVVGRRSPEAGIPVGAAQGGQHHFPRCHLDTRHLYVVHDPAPRGLDWAVVAQQFVGHRRVHRLVGPYQVHLVRVAQQSVGAVADQVDRGLVPGHEQERSHGEQLRLGHPVALLLDLDQVGQEVGGWILALCGDGFGEVPVHVHGGVHGRVDLFGGQERLEGLGKSVGPGADLGHVCLGEAKHGVDHRERDHEGVVGNEVDLVPVGELVQQVVHDGRGLVAHTADGPRGKGALHQFPEPGVVRRVQPQDGRHPLVLAVPEGQHVFRGRLTGLEPPNRSLRVAEHLVGVVVARYDQDAEWGPVHGVFVPQAGVVRVRVQQEVWIEWVPGRGVNGIGHMTDATDGRPAVSKRASVLSPVYRPTPTSYPERMAPSM